MTSLYLASGSPRRRELLTQIGVPFETVSAAIDETPLPNESPVAYVERLARGKAAAGRATLADATGVFVIRNAPQDIEKPIHIYQLDLKDATAYALGNEFKLRANDVVYITAAPVTRWNRVVSQLINSFTGANSLTNTFD